MCKQIKVFKTLGNFGNHPAPHPNPYKINCKYIAPVEVDPFHVGVYGETTCVSACVCVCMCMRVCQAPEKCWCLHICKETPGAIHSRSQLLLVLEFGAHHIQAPGKTQSRQLSGVPRTSQPRASSEETPLRKWQGILKRIPWHFMGREVDNSEMTHS